MSELEKQALLKKQKILRAKVEREATQPPNQAPPTTGNQSSEVTFKSMDVGSPVRAMPEPKTKSEDRGHEGEIVCPSPNRVVNASQPAPAKKDDHAEKKQTRVRFGLPRATPALNMQKRDSSEKIVKQNPQRDTKVRVSKGVALKSAKQKALEIPAANTPQTLELDKKKTEKITAKPEAKVSEEHAQEKDQKLTSAKTVPENPIPLQVLNTNQVVKETRPSTEPDPQKPKPQHQQSQTIPKPTSHTNSEPTQANTQAPTAPTQQAKIEHQQVRHTPDQTKKTLETIPQPEPTQPIQKKKNRMLKKIYFKQAEVLRLAVKNLEVAVGNMQYFAQLKRQGKLPAEFRQYIRQLHDSL